MNFRSITSWILIGLALTATATTLQAAEKSDEKLWGDQKRQGNVWGINLGWGSSSHTGATVRLLSMASHLTGDWGYIRHGFSPSDNIDGCKKSAVMIRAHRLINVGGGASPNKSFRDDDKRWAKLDADGSMRSAARDRAKVWAQMYEAKIPLYAVEVMNEVNMHNSFPPEKYAQWLYDFAVEVKKAYPGLKVCSAGMAGSGAKYYDEMLKFRPELKEVIDFWGLHPYGANNPPEYGPRGVALRSYVETIEALEKHNVDPIRLMCTETGYELEIGDVGKNTAYPPIKEDNRAEYMARAFRDYYVPDQRIETVAPFMLWDLPWRQWDGWQYVGHDARPKPIYYASAAEPKSGGNDWMETGDGTIEGRITWRDTSIGVPRVIVHTEPNVYGAVTDSDGYYKIRDLPHGNYTVKAFSDSFTTPTPRRVAIRNDKPARYDAKMARVSLNATWGNKPTNGIPGSWTPYQSDWPAGMFGIDGKVRAPNGDMTLRINATRPDELGIYNYSGYNAAYPNEVFIAEVYVKGQLIKGLKNNDGAPFLKIAATNGGGELLATAKATNPDFKPDGKWYRFTTAILGPPCTSRVRIEVGTENVRGQFWFSKPFVGEADFPLPTDVDYKTTAYVPPLYDINKELFAQTTIDVAKRNSSLKAGTITGQVKDFRGRGIANATVASDSPMFVTVADDDGNFELTVPADQTLRVRSFAPGVEMAVSDPMTVKADAAANVDLQCAAPPAPAKLVNGTFDKFTKGAPGLMHGWSSFNATDGATGSGQMIFESKSYKGEGLYFAQAGSNVKNGGAYQTVQAKPGTTYRLTGWVYTRTEGKGKRAKDNNCRIGIDPTGGRDPESSDVVWTDHTESDQKWTEISVDATAETERLTVFVRHEMRRANTWNLCLFDELTLEEVEK